MRARLLVLAVFLSIAIAATFGRRDVAPKTAPSTGAPASPSPRTNLPSWTAPPRADLEGWVVDDAGRAITTARACATSLSAAHTDEESGPTCADVGEDGKFHIAAIAAGRWDVVATAPGFVPARAEPYVDVDALAGAPRVTVRLARGGVAVEGSVEDPLGRPVAGAKIHAYATTLTEITIPDVTTTADASGHFVLWVPAGSIDLEATADGYAKGEDVVPAPTALAKLKLSWEAVLTGRVVDATGIGVPFARVEVDGPDSKTVRAKEDGSFAFAGLTAGSYRFDAIAPGLRGSAPSVLVDPGGRVDGVTITVAHAARVALGVTLRDGTACPDGSVSLRGRSEDDAEYADIDARGEAVFDAVWPGTFDLEITCTDRGSARGRVTVGVADVSGLAFVIDPGLAIRGVLVDAAGAPIVNASVSAHPAATYAHSAYATTKSDGSFALVGLVPGEVRIESSDPHHVDVETKLTVTADVGGLRLVAARGAVVRGTVVDEKGVPVRAAEVSLQGASLRSAFSRDDGSFRIEGVLAGHYEASVHVNGVRLSFVVEVPDPEVGLPFEVEGDEAVVDLRVARPSRVITGRVVDASGAGVAEASVFFRREWSEDDVSGVSDSDEHVLTDEDGRFRIAGLADGRYSLRARRKDVGEGFVSHLLAPATTSIALVAHGSATVLLDAVATRADVRLSGPDRAVWRREIVIAGDRARFDDLPAGTYDVSVSTEAGDGGAKLTVTAGGSTTISLSLVPWSTIVGTSVDGVATLRCEDCARSHPTTVTIVNGTLRAERLPAGTYEVVVHDGPHLVASGRVVAPPGEVATVQLDAVGKHDEQDQ